MVNEDALGTNMMLKAELHRVKLQLAAMNGQTPAIDTALATSLAFDVQPNTAVAHAAQVCLAVPHWALCHATDVLLQHCISSARVYVHFALLLSLVTFHLLLNWPQHQAPAQPEVWMLLIASQDIAVPQDSYCSKHSQQLWWCRTPSRHW